MIRYILILSLLIPFGKAFARPADSSVVVLVTSLEAENPASNLASFFVQEGWSLDFGEIGEAHFSTQEREIAIAEDLEYMVNLTLHVKTVKEGPLPVFHIKIAWTYGGLNNRGPIEATRSEIEAYRQRYVPVYTQRIGSYIEQVVKNYKHALLAYPLLGSDTAGR